MIPFRHLQIVPDSTNIYLKDSKPQWFTFRHPFIHYLIKNSNSYVLRKLHFCCKFFVIHGKIALCKNLNICSDPSEPSYSDETLFLPPLDKSLNLAHKLFVYGEFNFTKQFSNPKALSALISNNLYCCEAETVYAEGQDISAFDFKFLLSKNAKSIVLKNFVFYYNYKLPRNTNENIYQIAERFPNIEKLEYQSACISCLAASPNRKRCRLDGSLICFMCGYKSFNKKRSAKYLSDTIWKFVIPRRHQKSRKRL